MEFDLFMQISVVVAVAALVSIIMRLLRQPLILGYIITGMVVGPSMFGLIKDHHAFETFSHIGVALLLFIIGLGLNMKVIKSLGKASFTTAAIVATTLGMVAFFVSLAFDFNFVTSLFIAISMLFSSTIVILKVLSDKHEMGRLYGRLAIGILLIEDIIATIAMIAAAMISQGNGADVSVFALLVLKAVGLGVVLWLFGMQLIPRMSKFLASSRELLFLFSIGWGLAIAALFEVAGFSSELGALFAGISLAGLPYATEMASKLKPLRDFFLVLFFVSLGELFAFDSIRSSILPALALSAVVMIGKPITVLSALALQRYTNFTSFKTAIHMSQISEFSIVLIIYAATLNVVDERAVAVITLAALITIALSTYLMRFDTQLYKLFEQRIRKFERKETNEKRSPSDVYPVLLFGYHKGGHEFLETFRKMKQRYLVVDYNPEIIEHLEEQGVRHAFGDVMDIEFLEEINAPQSKLVVSTIDSFAVNLDTLKYLRRRNPKISYICHAATYEAAAELYEHGASYVSLPHFIGSEKISNYIKKHGMSHKALSEFRDKHLVTIGRKATRG